MTKYIITATSEFIDDRPESEVVIDEHLTKIKEGRARLIDYFVDAKIAIQEVRPFPPERIKELNCPKHGKQPFVLTFAPDKYTCPITDCFHYYTFEDVWASHAL